MKLLVTGGVGFVGSHFVWAAHAAGLHVVVLDDFSAGAGATLPPETVVVRGDIGNRALLRSTLQTHAIDGAVHFAGRIQVGESVKKPGLYFDINFVRSLALLEELEAAGVRRVVFSSTAAVYGSPKSQPIAESNEKAPINPYGASKLAFEHALEGFERAFGMRWAALRYFNAAGAHHRGHLVEAHDPETHLIPLVLDAGLARRPAVTVLGTDYPTPDGTCLRDYIHVEDLAAAHLRALEVLTTRSIGPMNLGTGSGYSVKQVIDAAGELLGAPVPHTFGARREGDPPALVADASHAREVLGWRPVRSDLHTIVEDALRPRRR
jgi:UDP-glucose 4-epimerase